MGWDNGRELASLSGNGIAASYSYDADGLRTTKTVNGIKTTYQYLDGQLLYEKKGNTQLHYFYDVNGVIKGIQTITGSGESANYYVITNTRGDVTQIYDEAGSLQVVYTYDSWGQILSVKDGSGNEITDDNSVGRLNSLRYRGYYYDEETGLYYLQSRYYDPVVGRFVNTDAVEILQLTFGELNTNNLYSYCTNNPIIYSDPTGYLHLGKHWWNSIKFIQKTIDLLIIAVPMLWSLGGFMRAKVIAEKAGKIALNDYKNRSRKVLLETVVKLSKKLAVYDKKLAALVKGLAGTVVEGLFVITGSSIGELIAKGLDLLDGNPGDKYLWA